MGMERAERMSEQGEEGEEAVKLTPHREPSNTSPTAAPLPPRRDRRAAPRASPSPCLQPGPCPLTHFLKRSSTPALTLRRRPSPTYPPFSTTNRSTTSPT